MLSCRLVGVFLPLLLAALGGPSWSLARGTVLPGSGMPAPHIPDAQPAVQFARPLMLPGVGAMARRPYVANPVLATWAKAQAWTPKAGDQVTMANGQVQAWEPLEVQSDGILASPRLCGGFCHFIVNRDRPGVMMLEASGHLFVLANDQPLEGDVYGYGWARHPVLLRRGENRFLFLMLPRSDRLQVRLTAPPADAFFLPYDHTLAHALSGQEYRAWAAVPVVNATLETLPGATITAVSAGRPPVTTAVPPLPPLSLRKVPLELAAPAAAAGKLTFTLRLERHGHTLDARFLTVDVRGPHQGRLRTFRSRIDSSVQAYAHLPPSTTGTGTPGLLLTLHGSAVEAEAHLGHYQPKPWCHIVAPTNRRPYGFDWEDWGRLDALEVLELAQQDLGTDPRRTWLTGHSMGGHGVWHIGSSYPDRFAALAPCAGWISTSCYTRQPTDPPDTPLEELLRRGTALCDPLAKTDNLRQPGIYVLHGDKDKTVPVQHARKMREALGALGKRFEYHEQPGAGHWWGPATVDNPELLAFLARHTLPAPADVHEVRFATACPGISATCHWATVEAQEKQWQCGKVYLHRTPAQRRIQGTTSNVSRLSLDLSTLPPNAPVQVELDGQKLPPVPWPAEQRLWLQRNGGTWAVIPRPSLALKGPHRSGGFKDAFRHRFLFVYGTTGTSAENAWALSQARYLAAVFWHRGNGSVDILPDYEYAPAAEPDRNVILLGNADTNAAWPALLGSCPVQMRRGSIHCGTRHWEGNSLGGLFLYPRPGSDTACVGVIGGTGLPGMRAVTFLPIFVSGVSYPDCLIVDAAMLTEGLAGIRCAGYFGNDWQVATGEFVYAERGASAP